MCMCYVCFCLCVCFDMCVRVWTCACLASWPACFVSLQSADKETVPAQRFLLACVSGVCKFRHQPLLLPFLPCFFTLWILPVCFWLAHEYQILLLQPSPSIWPEMTAVCPISLTTLYWTSVFVLVMLLRLCPTHTFFRFVAFCWYQNSKHHRYVRQYPECHMFCWWWNNQRTEIFASLKDLTWANPRISYQQTVETFFKCMINNLLLSTVLWTFLLVHYRF